MTFSCVLLLLLIGTLASDAQSVGGSCVTPDGRPGSCISILNCEPVKGVLVQVASKILPFSELRKYICHLGKEPFVCCPQESTPRPPNPPSPTNPPNPFPPSSRRPPPQPSPSGGSQLLPSRCGEQGLADRIIAGQPAPLGAWPWMVILRGKIGNRGTWHCGGTLISDRYVLTAAHCLDQRSGVELEFARIGEHTLGQNPDCNPFGKCAPPPQDILVEQIIVHPSYDRPCNECNDIALLRLARPVTLNRNYVQPICLPLNPRRDMGFSVQEFQGKAAWAAGWGTVSQDPRNVIRPDVLQQVQLPVQDLPFCVDRKRSYPDQSMVMCAGGDGRDTCQGDSGGPLALTSNVGSKYFLVGVTSKGPTVCGAESTQGFYTSVHHYMPWILSNLQP